MATQPGGRARFFSCAGGRLLAPTDCGEGADDLDQRRAKTVQLLEMDGREVPEILLGRRHQADQNTPAVPRVVPAFGESGAGEPVHQFDRAMVADAEALREIVDAERLAVWAALDREQRLVLAWGQAGAAGRPLAEFKKPAEQVAELGELTVLGRTEPLTTV